LAQYDLVIYHHGIYFPEFNKYLERYSGHLVIRYHNVTPASFFTPYKKQSEAAYLCEMGRQQTALLVNKYKHTAYWLADSAYNAKELVDLGVHNSQKKLGITPPFMYLDNSEMVKNKCSEKKQQAEAIFVGRFAPNKGHIDLVKVIYAYKLLISEKISLKIVGSQDNKLAAYIQEVKQLISDLDLEQQIEIIPFVSDERLQKLYNESSVFLCTSLHEGFCVPIVEAQAKGLPVVTINAAAIGETLGKNQLSTPIPEKAEDYFILAQMINIATFSEKYRDEIISNGLNNINERFSPEKIEKSFLDNLLIGLRERGL